MISILYEVTAIRLLKAAQDTPVDEHCEIFPFSRLYLEIRENYLCPFCGANTVMYKCTCDEFTEKFTRLQESYGDDDHQSMIHLYPYENIISCPCKNVTYSTRLLTKQEISQIDPMLWDNAMKVSDMETSRSFSIINPVYNGEDLEFICKDLQSGSIYNCSVTGIGGYKNHKFYLGIPRQKPVYRPGDDKTLTHSYKNENWQDLPGAEFSDWDELCKRL